MTLIEHLRFENIKQAALSASSTLECEFKDRELTDSYYKFILKNFILSRPMFVVEPLICVNFAKR